VCKYGYLFIAPPDLDLNKTKRWQWRFFIFYDDSELTYSLDENPLTLPQGRINISKCESIVELNTRHDIDVAMTSTSSNIGGGGGSLVSYPNSLCLKFSPPNKDVYIAAGNYEEIAKWRDVLLFHCSRHLSVTSILKNDKAHNETENKRLTMSGSGIRKTRLNSTRNSKNFNEKAKSKNQQPPPPPPRRIIENTNIDQLEDFVNIDDIQSENENDQEDYDEYDDGQEINAILQNKKNEELEGEEEEEDEEEGEELVDENNYEIFETTEKNLHQTSSNKNTNSKSSKILKKLSANFNKNKNLKLKMISEIKRQQHHHHHHHHHSNKQTDDQKLSQEQQQQQQSEKDLNNEDENDGDGGGGGVGASGRRLSYKEDDLLRKQRLKENLNALLIEYKHEEEANMKKLSKFASTSNTMNTTPVTGARVVNNRASLDSQCSSSLSNKIAKSSAFSLVVPPQQLMQQQQQNNANKNSAFRPVIASSSTSTTTNQVKLGLVYLNKNQKTR
jgi:hypothetical protein